MELQNIESKEIGTRFFVDKMLQPNLRESEIRKIHLDYHVENLTSYVEVSFVEKLKYSEFSKLAKLLLWE